MEDVLKICKQIWERNFTTQTYRNFWKAWY